MRWAGLASGTGSNLDAMFEHGLMLDLVMVDRYCPAEEKALAHGLQVSHIPRTGRIVKFYDNGLVDVDEARADFTLLVARTLLEHGIELVAMAGWMSVFSRDLFFGAGYGGKVLNLHPALLPSFKGEKAVADALDAGVLVTGTTVHIATERLDEGPILAQAPVEVKELDTEETLHNRIKAVEHELYPDVVWKVLNGEIDLAAKWERWVDMHIGDAEGEDKL